MTNFKFKIPNLKLLSLGYLITLIGLFLYSFTQVDLSLTLSKWSVWQVIEKFFQQIGYFSRPLSTAFFLALIILLFIFYVLFLFLSYKNKINRKQVWCLIILTVIILLFSYNAFSYDLFNYIFDAKIITHYHQNPYIHRALDFPGDPMLSFMHWTQRVYPYGPFWLVLTVPLSYLGFGFFLPTLFLFKALASLSFLGIIYYLEKILNKLGVKNNIFNLVFFAFNPLVILEELVSAHNDIEMMFLAVLSIYLFMNMKYTRPALLFIISAATKFATVLALPFFILSYLKSKGQNISWDTVFLVTSFFMVIAVVISSIRTEFQPWYMIWVLPFVALLTRQKWAMIISIVFSQGVLLQYLPFLYTGAWNPPIPTIKFWIIIGSLLAGIITSFVYLIIKRQFVLRDLFR